MPVFEDAEEAPYVYDFLCDLVQANHPVVLGENNANLPKILEIVAEAFQLNALPVDCEAYKKLIFLVKQVHVRVCTSESRVASIQLFYFFSVESAVL